MHNLNKLWRGSLDDATYQGSRPSGFGHEFFYVLCFIYVTYWTGHFGPRGITCLNSADNGELTICILETPIRAV